VEESDTGLEDVETNVRSVECCQRAENGQRSQPQMTERGIIQYTSEVNDTTKFLKTELADFNTMTGTSNMVGHQIKMKMTSQSSRDTTA